MSSQVLIAQVSSPPITAWVRLLRTHAAVTRELSAKLVADHGLTINDYEALLLLSHADAGAMRRVDLAQELVLTPSGVTRLLDGLERSGWVEKGACKSDARVTYAVLTKRGRAKLEEASRSHLAQVRAFFEERFSEEELRSLASLLGRLSGGGDGAACRPG
jgi:DNA-binding MarR family transcriptional regulator